MAHEMKPHPAIVVVAAIMLAACSAPPAATVQSVGSSTTTPAGSPQSNPDGCVERYDPEVDYFPEKVELHHVQSVQVRYAKHYKVVSFAFDRFAAGLRPDTLVMVQCGTPAPPLEGELANAHVIQVPVKTATITRNEDLAVFVSLGLADGLKSQGWPKVYPPDIDARIQSGALKDTGGGLNPSQLNFELVADLQPDLVVIGSPASPAGVAALDRLRQLGLQAMPSLTTSETTPLGRAEWAKVVSMPFNREGAANNLVGDIFRRYTDLSAKATAKPSKPTVFFAQCGTNGECTVARNSWQARILEDAGARNVLADPGPQSLQPMGIEAVFEAGADVDFWVWYSVPGEKYRGPLLERFRAFQQDHILGNDTPGLIAPNGEVEFFYLSALRPDLLLEDMVAAFHPDLVPDHRPRFIGRSPYR
jgi:iron complex transport system substrate-binding protein